MNLPPTFIPSLQHEAQTCHVLCYRWLQRIGLLVAVARRHPTAITVQCMQVNETFKHRRAASLFDVCSQNRRRLFSLHRRDVCAVSVLVSKHFFRYRYRLDTGGIGRYRVPDAGIGLTLALTLSTAIQNEHLSSKKLQKRSTVVSLENIWVLVSPVMSATLLKQHSG